MTFSLKREETLERLAVYYLSKTLAFQLYQMKLGSPNSDVCDVFAHIQVILGPVIFRAPCTYHWHGFPRKKSPRIQLSVGSARNDSRKRVSSPIGTRDRTFLFVGSLWRRALYLQSYLSFYFVDLPTCGTLGEASLGPFILKCLIRWPQFTAGYVPKNLSGYRAINVVKFLDSN